MPTGDKDQPLRPICGEPAEIAEALLAYRRLGITHLQINMDQMTTAAIEQYAPVLALLDKAAQTEPEPGGAER